MPELESRLFEVSWSFTLQEPELYPKCKPQHKLKRHNPMPRCGYPATADSDLIVHTDPCRMAIDSALLPRVNEKGLEESNAIQLTMHI